jgi:hypothetical protein
MFFVFYGSFVIFRYLLSQWKSLIDEHITWLLKNHNKLVKSIAICIIHTSLTFNVNLNGMGSYVACITKWELPQIEIVYGYLLNISLSL